MSKTYQTRPPDSAKAAQRAWDYFAEKYSERTIETLAYSPKCDGLPGWVCELKKPEGWSLHWGASYSTDWWIKSAPCETIKRWERCDCQAPVVESGAAGVSEDCPIHGVLLSTAPH